MSQKTLRIFVAITLVIATLTIEAVYLFPNNEEQTTYKLNTDSYIYLFPMFIP